MTDRELLEKAARAAGVPVFWSDDGTLQKRPILVVMAGGGNGTMQHEWPWNPLNDDGDALRLAVKLRITVTWLPFKVVAMKGFGGHHEWIKDKDAGSAARRAIVRAAAAMAEEDQRHE